MELLRALYHWLGEPGPLVTMGFLMMCAYVMREVYEILTGRWHK